jgi:hypothetical protein
LQDAAVGEYARVVARYARVVGGYARAIRKPTQGLAELPRLLSEQLLSPRDLAPMLPLLAREQGFLAPEQGFLGSEQGFPMHEQSFLAHEQRVLARELEAFLREQALHLKLVTENDSLRRYRPSSLSGTPTTERKPASPGMV